MFKNYLATAWRNLRKYKVYSIICVSGMTLALSAFWLIELYVFNELSYDRYYQDSDRIYRAVSHAKWAGGSFDVSATPTPLAITLKADYPEVEATTRIEMEGGGTISFGTNHIKEGAILYADSTFFQIFSHQFLYGDKLTALKSPQSIVLTKSLAITLFGNPAKALNKIVKFENNYPNLVTGVIADVPSNSHIIFSALRSFPKDYNEDWAQMHLISYIKLKKGADIKKLEAALPQLVAHYIKPDLSSHFKSINYRLELQPLTAIHLNSTLDFDYGEHNSLGHVYFFSMIGFLVLLIAIINYVNLTTSRASVRIKEVGIRRVIGATKGQLIKLFLTESLLITALATIVAGFVSITVFPWYTALIGKNISINTFSPGVILLFILSVSLITVLASGIYPALHLCRFRLIPSLKGETGNQWVDVLLRKSLVLAQFIVTIGMISCSLVIYKQLKYMLQKDLGFNKEQIVTFHLESDKLRNNIDALKNELTRNPAIEAVAAAGIQIGNNYIGKTAYLNPSASVRPGVSATTNYLSIDEDYLSTLKLRLKRGRNFSRQFPGDRTTSVIVNESLAKECGWKDLEAKRIVVDEIPLNVIGVVKDFHFASLQHKIEPLLLALPSKPAENDNLYVRVSSRHVAEAIKYIERTVYKFDSNSSFTYTFLDQTFAMQYSAEQKQGNILLLFTIVSILLASMGLYGLVTFALEQRNKEIAIRRVLGASIKDILSLIAANFIGRIFLAMLIAVPVAWWLMLNWLNSFAYRISLNVWIFLFAGILAIVLALITISFKAFKVALTNPIKNLRTE